MNEPLPWQSRQWEQMMQRKTAGRLPHALLCCGPAGLGKALFAERLAQALLCDQPGPAGIGCGVCRSCHLFAAGSHPDYWRVEPAEEGRPIRVDQVRGLTAFLSHTSRFSGYKIVLLLPAERMNINAANSLLKTLEEPPMNSVLLLVSAAPARLPATVRSRCQTLVFQEPGHDQAIAWLAFYLKNTSQAALLLSLAGGSPLLARSYAEQDCLARRRQLFDSYRQVIAGRTDPLRAAELWVQGRVSENLRWLIGWYMDMIRLKMVKDPPRLFNTDLQDALRQLAGKSTLRALFRGLDRVARIHELCATQVNTQLMIESFLADCASE